MEVWKEYKLADVVEINPTESLKKGTIAKKIGMDVLQPYCRSIPSFLLEPYTGGTKFKNGDTIMARITPCLENGKTAMVDILDDNEIGFGSTEYIVFRAKKNITDPYFIYYLVTSDCIRNPAIKSMVGSSGRQRVQTDVVANLSIKLPPLSTQQKIAAILSSLDDKIELNNKITNNLEQQANTLFKNWFVDSNNTNQFSLKQLEEVTENLRERITNQNTPVLSAVNTGKLQRSDEYFSKQVYSKDISKYILVKKGDFAYNPARVNIGSIGINDLGYDGCVSPVYVAFSVDPDYRSFFKYFVKSNTFNEEAKTRASGSVRQTLNYSDFAKIEIKYPPRDLAKQFEAFNSTIEVCKRKIEKETETLISIRDTLLPKLMNGEIEV